MALFFDRLWFTQRLAQRNVTRADLALCAGLSEASLDLMFKDQMEVSAEHVRAWALVLGESEVEIAKRCGVSTPTPRSETNEQRFQRLEIRIEALERQIAILLRQPNAQS